MYRIDFAIARATNIIPHRWILVPSYCCAEPEQKKKEKRTHACERKTATADRSSTTRTQCRRWELYWSKQSSNKHNKRMYSLIVLPLKFSRDWRRRAGDDSCIPSRQIDTQLRHYAHVFLHTFTTLRYFSSFHRRFDSSCWQCCLPPLL